MGSLWNYGLRSLFGGIIEYCGRIFNDDLSVGAEEWFWYLGLD